MNGFDDIAQERRELVDWVQERLDQAVEAAQHDHATQRWGDAATLTTARIRELADEIVTMLYGPEPSRVVHLGETDPFRQLIALRALTDHGDDAA
jgi:hypothetical protein